MSRGDWIAVAAFVTYVVGGFLTYGHIYNEREASVCGERDSVCEHFKSTAPVDAMFGGIAWPIYWGAQIGVMVTAPK